jgi:hypothetical protein
MAEPQCSHCSWRGGFDRNPKSLLGRLWRWHINWCPGWKAYYDSLPPDKQAGIRVKYNWKKR